MLGYREILGRCVGSGMIAGWDGGVLVVLTGPGEGMVREERSCRNMEDRSRERPAMAMSLCCC